MIEAIYPRLDPNFDKSEAKDDTLPYIVRHTKPTEEIPRRARSWRDHNYWFIGDVHGNFGEYQNALARIRKADKKAITIQVGDLELTDPSQVDFLGPKDFFIQGNHDDFTACCKHPNFLGRFGFKHGLFYTGGAKTGKGGYSHEELSHKDLADAVELYEKTKPEIVVTHDCPQSIRETFFFKKEKTRTTEALQEMWNIHAPLLWVFGHHHWAEQQIVDGTDFVCVSPLQSHQMKLTWTHGYTERQKASRPIEMTAGKVISRFISSWNPFK